MKGRDNDSVRLTISFALAVSLFRFLSAAENTTDFLRRQTQELFDAIPSGLATVWDRYLDDRTSYTDEAGAVLSKKEMVAQLKPFPTEITGAIKVTDFRVSLHGSVAITTHLDDEHETYYGHELHCQYRIRIQGSRHPRAGGSSQLRCWCYELILDRLTDGSSD